MKPVLLYDGDCGFCRRWIESWRRATGERVEYAPYQEAAERFPQISQSEFTREAKLVEADGTVYGGAEAVLRALIHAPGRAWAYWCYRRIPGFGLSSRIVYRFVAGHRRGLSHITNWLWGRTSEPETYCISRQWFLRLLAVIYLIAFLSFRVQVPGLIGKNGIVPAVETLAAYQKHFGDGAFWKLPTIAWWASSDEAILRMCDGGVVLSLLLLYGVAPIPILVFLWALYLSLVNVGGVFMHFQWDILLLETGFLALFYAPLRLYTGRRLAGNPFGLSRLLMWWLLFRLMFRSGYVKLAGDNPTWENLLALTLHYETQPLPICTSWLAHQLPLWFHKASCAIMFGIELGLPFLIIAPRRLRHLAAGAFIFLMLLIAATGNYNFFNLLTVALCVTLLDDGFLARLTIRRTRDQLPRVRGGPDRRPLTRIALGCAALAALAMTAMDGYLSTYREWNPPNWVRKVLVAVQPFHAFNQYGLFARMTESRPEIVIEGSRDGSTWLEYEFSWKPGDVKRPPGFVQPHQPRLDWQMWFAALGTYQRNPWFGNLLRRILEGRTEVLALFEKNPFAEGPPRYVRATLYRYYFTDAKTRRETGAWWNRERLGLYAKPMSLTRK